MVNNAESAYTVRIPEHFLDKLHRGQVTASMWLTLSILYKWANWNTGIVPHASAGGLHTWSNGAYSIRTFQEDLRRLEKKKHLTRQNAKGVKGDYSIILHNYPHYHSDTGELKLLNPTSTDCTETSTDRRPETSTQLVSTKREDTESSTRVKDASRTETSTDARRRPSGKVLSENLSENKSENDFHCSSSTTPTKNGKIIRRSSDPEQGTTKSPDPNGSDRPKASDDSYQQEILTLSASLSPTPEPPAPPGLIPTESIAGITPERIKELVEYIQSHTDDPSYKYYVADGNLCSRSLRTPAFVQQLDNNLSPRMARAQVAEKEARLKSVSKLDELADLFMPRLQHLNRNEIKDAVQYLIDNWEETNGAPLFHRSAYEELEWLLTYIDEEWLIGYLTDNQGWLEELRNGAYGGRTPVVDYFVNQYSDILTAATGDYLFDHLDAVQKASWNMPAEQMRPV